MVLMNILKRTINIILARQARIDLFFFSSYYLIFLISIVSIYMVSASDDFFRFLYYLTKDFSFFEIVSVVFSLSSSILLFIIYFQIRRTGLYKIYKFFTFMSAILLFVVSICKVTITQHNFHANDMENLLLNNRFYASDLGGLIPFYMIWIYLSIYLFFVIIPILYKMGVFKTNNLDKRKQLEVLMPKNNQVLMFFFSSIFQAYFYFDLGGFVDTVVFIASFIMIILWILNNYKKDISGIDIMHFVFINIAFIIAILSYKNFSYIDMQYEIRDCISIVAFSYWALSFSSKFVVDENDDIVQRRVL